jgi:circadian clock protein KaiB
MMGDNLILILYLAGVTPVAKRALTNIRTICEKHVEGHYSLEVIDLLEKPAMAESDQIFAVPTLVRRHPGPVRKMIGDLSDHARVLAGMEIHAAAGS